MDGKEFAAGWQAYLDGARCSFGQSTLWKHGWFAALRAYGVMAA